VTGPRRALLLGGVALGLLVASGLVAYVVTTRGSGPPSLLAGSGTPASEPFEGLTETVVRAGSRDLRVVIADDPDERSEGLRSRRDLGPYDAMLFVFADDTTAAFTMAGVPVALDIGFYGATGRRVDHLEMVPCSGTDFTCPVYQARSPFRFALETLAGELPPGRLSRPR
jgi:uncharacterized membrane protein (UPF0127 family)